MRYSAIIVQSIALDLFGVAYLTGIELLTESLWGDDRLGTDWFSGTTWSVLIPVAGGPVVGVACSVFHLPARFPGFIEDLERGEVDAQTTPGAVGIAVVSPITGPSPGPEAPLGAAGGAAGTWLARRRNQGAVRSLSGPLVAWPLLVAGDGSLGVP